MRFEALYYPERLHELNPWGDVGLITLWSPFTAVERKLRAEAPLLLDPSASRIAVIANLYGDGMFAMFCNLLFNPQIRHLVAIGQDLALGATSEIEAFLERGLEDAVLLGQPVKRVPGTLRSFPSVAEFDVERLRRQLAFHDLGKLSAPALTERLQSLLAALPSEPPVHSDRLQVDMPLTSSVEQRPSLRSAHQVERSRPLACWRELVVRVVRFGRHTQLGKGPRLELDNARAVITAPEEEPPAALEEYGFDLGRFHAYQRAILNPALPEGIAYSYGNRLRGYFDLGSTRDTLELVIERLREDARSRRAYTTLWDNRADLADIGNSGSKPCLTTLFFRDTDDGLTLTATYRAHNLLTAWLENVYGLIAIQRHVADALGRARGSVTVISHSLGIDTTSPRFALALALERDWAGDEDVDPDTGKRRLREDPNGYFVVSVDREAKAIVAEHRYEGVLLKRYTAARAETIEHQVASDMAISLVSHAMWLGRELARAERSLARPATRTAGES
jgi:thymidylate synthase